MTVTIDLGPELEGELRDQAAREGLDAGGFILNTVRERLRQRRPAAPRLSKKETELLLKINAGLPEETWRRHRALDKKRRAETLTPEEHAELLELNDRIEEDGVQRIGCVAELAQLRGKTLEEMMQSLGLGPRRHA